MTKNNKKIILTVVFILLFAGVVAGAYFGYKTLSGKTESQGQTPSIQNNGNYKDFGVVDQDGKEVKLSDFIGKPVVINFWASWCPPCKSELPHFDKLAKEYEGRVDFLMVNLAGEKQESVKNFVRQNGYTFPLYFDTAESGAKAYSVSSIPKTVFITADGDIGAERIGAMSEAVLRNYIEQLLKDKGD